MSSGENTAMKLVKLGIDVGRINTYIIRFLQYLSSIFKHIQGGIWFIDQIVSIAGVSSTDVVLHERPFCNMPIHS
jgi:hypothetical protein